MIKILYFLTAALQGGFYVIAILLTIALLAPVVIIGVIVRIFLGPFKLAFKQNQAKP